MSFLIAYYNQMIQIKIKNKDDMMILMTNMNSFIRAKYSLRFKNYLCGIYYTDEYVKWLPVETVHLNTDLLLLYAP